MEDTNTKTKKEQPQTRAKPLTADAIRKITQQAKSGFPEWAEENYGTTHVLRWISQSRLYNDESLVDRRGYEMLRDPKTGRTARWNEMLLGAMPKEIAIERRQEVKEDLAAQEDYVRENVEGAQDRLRYELERAGYSTPKSTFEYSKSK